MYSSTQQIETYLLTAQAREDIQFFFNALSQADQALKAKQADLEAGKAKPIALHPYEREYSRSLQAIFNQPLTLAHYQAAHQAQTTTQQQLEDFNQRIKVGKQRLSTIKRELKQLEDAYAEILLTQDSSDLSDQQRLQLDFEQEERKLNILLTRLQQEVRKTEQQFGLWQQLVNTCQRALLRQYVKKEWEQYEQALAVFMPTYNRTMAALSIADGLVKENVRQSLESQVLNTQHSLYESATEFHAIQNKLRAEFETSLQVTETA